MLLPHKITKNYIDEFDSDNKNNINERKHSNDKSLAI